MRISRLRSDFATKLFGVRVNIWTALVAIVGGLAWLFWRGSPVDGEATERLRAGTTMAEIIGGEGVRPPLAADTASAAPPENEDVLAEQPGVADEPVVADAAGGAGELVPSDEAAGDEAGEAPSVS